MIFSNISERSNFKCYKCNTRIYKDIILFSAKERVLCKNCIERENEAKTEPLESEGSTKADVASKPTGKETISERVSKVLAEKRAADKYAVEEVGFLVNNDFEEEGDYSETPQNGIKSPAELVKILDEHIVGQHSAKRSIAVAIFNHMMRTEEGTDSDLFPRSNIILCGPTGTGKTEIFRTISRELDIPLAIGDATTLTSAGYRGDDIESLLTSLLQQTDGNIAKAQRGIVYIDEFDKICGITDTKQDGYNKLLQENLLKLIEGKEADVPVSGVEKTKTNTVKFNTSNILFVCGGAFTGIRKEAEEENEFKGNIGFIKTDVPEDRPAVKRKERLVAADFIKYGIIQELCGRLPIVVELESLSKEQLKEIMVKPKNSVYRKYCNLFERMGIKLSITDGAMDVLAERAMSLNIGARALNAVLEEYMEHLVYEYAGNADRKRISVTKTMVEKHFAELDRKAGSISA